MRILIATGNPGKFKEIVAILAEAVTDSAGIDWASLADLPSPIDEPEETGLTFADNAALKARHYSLAAGMWALADDSGLEVDALGGEPGVHSAYYASESAHLPRQQRDAANNARLIAALLGIPIDARTARFRCCLALADGQCIIATAVGHVEGHIIDTPRGSGGFGYDPHFLIPELGRTTAELSPDEKNRLSHRGRALRVMREKLLAAGLGDGG